MESKEAEFIYNSRNSLLGIDISEILYIWTLSTTVEIHY